MPENQRSQLVQLIQKSFLISNEMKEHLVQKTTSFTEAQQQEMITAIRQSEEDLKQILTDALKQDEEKLLRIQRKLDDVWKAYMREVEKISHTQEENEQEDLLKKLDE